MSHGQRPRFGKIGAVHVILRARDDVWNLRSGRCFRRILRCFERARGRFGVRLIQFSVMGNHLHLIIEADDWFSLGRGMKGVEVRLARSLNNLMNRRGGLFDDHYRAELLPTPAQLCEAIAYVLGNAKHHYGEAGLDWCSSAGIDEEVRARATSPPLGWLLRVGWRRARQAAKLEPYLHALATPIVA